MQQSAKRLYDFEGCAPLVHSDIEPGHVTHPDCDPRPVPRDWELIRYAIKLVLAFITVAAVLIGTMLPVRSAPAPGPLPESTCETVRYYVKQYGYARALAWAIENGYKRGEILAALRCLRQEKK